MTRPFVLTALILTGIVAGPVSPVLGVPTISIGTIHLQPDTPGQLAEIHVTGGDQVEGINLYIIVANGGPEFEVIGELPLGAGIAGPAITFVDTITGTIFAANNDGQAYVPDGPVNLPQYATVYTLTNSGTVPAEGLLARVTLDTTGFFEGTFALSLTAFGEQTDFTGIPASITDGFIVIDAIGPPGTNQPPLANAGPDQQVQAGATVQLAGSGSDPESASLTYQWRQIDGPAVVLSDWSNPTASFTAPQEVINTTLVFELTVSDGENTRTDTVTITVSPNAALFTVNAGPDQSVAPGALVHLAGTITSSHPRSWSIEWLQVGGPTADLTGSTTANPTFLAPTGITNTQLTFEFRVFDGTYEAVDTVTVTVDVNNARPTAYAGEDQAVAAGATVQLQGSGTDPAGLGLSYLWVQIDGPTVLLSNETVANPTFTAPSLSADSKLEFELRVSSDSITSIDTVAIHVAAAPPDPNTQDPTQDSTDEEADYEVPAQTQQWVFPFADYSTSTAIAVGIGLLLLALLFLWIFVL